MQTRQLTEDEFKATMTPKMHNVTETATNVLDVWPYVDSVPSAELKAISIHDRFIEVVYRSDDDRFDHVLVMTKTKNVYLAVVVDLARDCIYDHRLLDMNREYGQCSDSFPSIDEINTETVRDLLKEAPRSLTD